MKAHALVLHILRDIEIWKNRVVLTKHPQVLIRTWFPFLSKGTGHPSHLHLTSTAQTSFSFIYLFCWDRVFVILVINLLFISCEWVCTTSMPDMPAETQRTCRFSGNGVINCHESSWGCWELNFNVLKKQPVNAVYHWATFSEIGSFYVALVHAELRDPLDSAFPELGLKVFATMLSLRPLFV